MDIFYGTIRKTFSTVLWTRVNQNLFYWNFSLFILTVKHLWTLLAWTQHTPAVFIVTMSSLLIRFTAWALRKFKIKYSIDTYLFHSSFNSWSNSGSKLQDSSLQVGMISVCSIHTGESSQNIASLCFFRWIVLSLNPVPGGALWRIHFSPLMGVYVYVMICVMQRDRLNCETGSNLLVIYPAATFCSCHTYEEHWP